MGVASGCGEQEVGVASGSGWNLSCICSFFKAESLLSVHFKNVFRSCA